MSISRLWVRISKCSRESLSLNGERMTQVFGEDGTVVPVTVIEAGPCRVTAVREPERDGYAAVQLAFGATKPQRLSKPELGHLKKADAPPTRHGPASITVTGTMRFCSSQIWVMPSLRPRIPLAAMSLVLFRSRERSAR